MIRREEGFSLIELMVTMTIFVIVIAASSQVFTGLLTQFKQQGKIAETNIGGIVGLDLLRRDLGHAGYGLPWNVMAKPGPLSLRGVTDADADGNFWEDLPNYAEAISSGNSPDPIGFNDATRNVDGDGTDGESPRSVVFQNNADFTDDTFDLSDYLVIKSLKVGNNFTAGKWQYVWRGPGGYQEIWWAPTTENICRKDDNSHDGDVRTIVISPGMLPTNMRALVVYNNIYQTGADSNNAGFVPPAGDGERQIMYGVDPDTNLRMPFNRADYYISRPASGMPSRCAPNTGILYKATINHSDGARSPLPLVDCVADFQVVFGLDMDQDGAVGTFSDLDTAVNAPGDTEDALPADVQATFQDAGAIRARLREIRVYILTHEGQKETFFEFDNFTGSVTCPKCIRVGMSASLGRDFDLSAITDYNHYRWKVYALMVELNNLQ